MKYRDMIRNKISEVYETMRDEINNPPHYNYGNIQTIDYIVDVLDNGGALDYCQGNVIKYTGTRMFTKGDPKENIKKAIWYLNKMLELLEK